MGAVNRKSSRREKEEFASEKGTLRGDHFVGFPTVYGPDNTYADPDTDRKMELVASSVPPALQQRSSACSCCCAAATIPYGPAYTLCLPDLCPIHLRNFPSTPPAPANHPLRRRAPRGRGTARQNVFVWYTPPDRAYYPVLACRGSLLTLTDTMRHSRPSASLSLLSDALHAKRGRY